MSTRVTQKIYKVSTSSPQAFSSCLYSSGPSVCIGSSAFFLVGSGYQVGLDASINLVRGYDGAASMGSIRDVQVNQRLLSPLKLEVDPNIQAVRSQEKEQQIKSLNNRFASFVNELWSLEKQNEILEAKWNLQQHHKMAHSNMYNMFESYISNLQWQLDMLAQVKLRLEVELGIVQGLVEHLNNYEDGIDKHQR